MSDHRLDEYDCARCGRTCFGICILGNSVVCGECFMAAMLYTGSP